MSDPLESGGNVLHIRCEQQPFPARDKEKPYALDIMWDTEGQDGETADLELLVCFDDMDPVPRKVECICGVLAHVAVNAGQEKALEALGMIFVLMGA